MTRDDSALLANVPDLDSDPYEVYDRHQQGFITYAEYTMFQIRRQDSQGYRDLLCSIVGAEPGSLNDEDLALAYHRFMVHHFANATP